ncbi:glutamate 5-kinase [Pasteurella skyensis]|uniref:Glutamate 5-kinase n=1 Tax=Phocoenobacter skyensis TaxID=97481 RepID=A0AAJ6NB62_9PAST|nr:glutamate 5-kinase [Pasteurella skyensis]MDP8163350.1 glutamate 5-kinase [Pasteurella skyensis]MDP8173593.1 glutamate 5-kinase [Pasteurella skyensis]MDP8177850.1 glutamate 5-kinase [Pasteurella skyensis]MDP8179800.1 glutamate 5-kinase [Pasteurella skyensis]MDP8183914.1 glutamate 5-kinase [Pasteurella skyensis]
MNNTTFTKNMPLKKDLQKTIVLKFGTSVLTQGTLTLHRPQILEIVRQCTELQKQGFRIVIVTSGAIAAGRDYLGNPKLPPTIASKQLLAAVGQSQLIQTWEQLFDIYNIKIGQVLLSRADVEDRERFLNARDVLNAMLDNQIIPIINENDAVATAEIKVGDNDNLSALTAIIAQADQLYLLTDQQGLFDSDPRSNPNAKLLSVVSEITDEIKGIAGDSVSGLGTGGMSTKITAADIATRSGIETIIASGSRNNVIYDLANGMDIGTKFTVATNLLESRKQWLFAAPTVGSLLIDTGAELALKQHKSMLPAGIVAVEGCFSRGEVILIKNSDNQAIARGMVRYNSEALELIRGKQSQYIEAILGYQYGSVAIHSNDMVLL